MAKAKTKATSKTPAPVAAAPPPDPGPGFRVSVDLIDDPDFVLSFSTKEKALAEVDSIVRRGYAIRDMRDQKSNRYEIRVHPLHRIRFLSLYPGEPRR